MKNTNILICGVGGQGILLAGEIISEVAMESGYDVKKSEVHGMAQRGGSVVSHVRYGEKIYSPLIRKGEADFIFSFERMETLRYLDYLRKDGTIIVNDQRISPTVVNIKEAYYPENVEGVCRDRAELVLFIPAIKIAEELGNIKIVNVVMLGALSRYINFDHSVWLKGIEQRTPKKYLQMNIKAFERGKEEISHHSPELV
jgi:indolepyruvate ferredoxin oxidoreductase beta subunit